MMLESVIEPVILGRKPNQHTGRSTMTCDDYFLLRREAEELRQVIFDFRERHRSRRRLGLPSLVRRARLAPRLS
jgi:hypothetical protein